MTAVELAYYVATPGQSRLNVAATIWEYNFECLGELGKFEEQIFTR